MTNYDALKYRLAFEFIQNKLLVKFNAEFTIVMHPVECRIFRIYVLFILTCAFIIYIAYVEYLISNDFKLLSDCPFFVVYPKYSALGKSMSNSSKKSSKSDCEFSPENNTDSISIGVN